MTLPPIIELSNLSWDEILQLLYDVFERDFKKSRPSYKGNYVIYDDHIDNGKERCFWHLVTKSEKKTNDRLIDYRRAERLPWVRPMIENYGDAQMLSWEESQRSRTVRVYLWLEKANFLVLLEHRNSKAVILITAYYIDQDHTRRKLGKRYQRYINNRSAT